jgi:hypothetical protein
MTGANLNLFLPDASIQVESAMRSKRADTLHDQPAGNNE